MKGSKGTDPNNLRVDAAKYLVANVSEKSAADNPNRLALIDFGDKVDLRSGLRPVTPSSGYQELADRIGPRDMGGTNVIGALRASLAALETAQSFETGRKGRVVLFTDGKPEDDRNLSLGQYFDEIATFVDKELTPHGYELYVIAVDAKGDIWAACGGKWTDTLGADHVVRILSVGELREKFNDVVNRIFSIPTAHPDVLTVGRKSFTVRPYLDRIEFHVFPSTPEMKLRILRPDRSYVRADVDKDVRRRQFAGYEIISVFDPPGGEWQYEIVSGEGRIEVFRNEVPLQMELVLPKTVHAQGKPITVVASFARHSGNPVASEPGYPLGLSAQVLGPTGNPKNVQFGEPINGLYYASETVPTKLTGLYKITLRVQAGTAFDTSTSYNVNVSERPYLDLRTGLTGFPLGQRFIRVSGTLKIGEKSTQSDKYFSNHPNLLYVAQVSKMPNGAQSPVQWLSSSDGTSFSTSFAAPVRTFLLTKQPLPGNYEVQVQHAGKTPSGESSADNDLSLAVVPVRSTPLGPLTGAVQSIAAAYIVALLLLWLILAVRVGAASKMPGNVTIRQSSTGEVLAQVKCQSRSWATCTTRARTGRDVPKHQRLRSARFVFWGVDRRGQRIGIASVWLGLPIMRTVRAGTSRYVGRMSIHP
jgi:hypothetical protein